MEELRDRGMNLLGNLIPSVGFFFFWRETAAVSHNQHGPMEGGQSRTKKCDFKKWRVIVKGTIP